jgi:hypothetical protein
MDREGAGMTREQNPVIFYSIAKPIPTTAEELGCQLACDSADKQASILCQWEQEIAGWGAMSWPMQCRLIAEAMTNEECHAVAVMLGTIIEHLESIPRERNSDLRAFRGDA